MHRNPGILVQKGHHKSFDEARATEARSRIHLDALDLHLPGQFTIGLGLSFFVQSICVQAHLSRNRTQEILADYLSLDEKEDLIKIFFQISFATLIDNAADSPLPFCNDQGL
ncbi:MAG: hypothetical protein OEY60_07325 [Nitrospira sp.]|nr:hypothetical protein [Nitrospira sp.]MDH5725270.1 hypothetical protein [Nitrospira sp.]